MIQRIQSVYLILVAILAGGLPFVFNLWRTNAGELVYAVNEPIILVGFLLAAVMSIVSIIKFNNRKSQFVLNRLNIILNFLLISVFVYRSLSLSGETAVSEKGIGMLLPIISIVLLVLANKAIKKDEDLVKSVDRIR